MIVINCFSAAAEWDREMVQVGTEQNERPQD